MKLTIPLYHEKYREENGDVHFVRPLFFDHVDASRAELRRATDSLRNKLRKLIQDNSAQPRHDVLSWYAQCPDITERQVKLDVRLKRRSFQATFMFAVYELGARRVAFTPRLPHLTFELRRNEKLDERAEEVLTAYYRKLDRDGQEFDPARDGIRGSGWLGFLDLNVDIDSVHVAPRKKDRAEIGSFDEMRGSDELARVGRNLNSLFPDDLDSAVRRDAVVRELLDILNEKDKRPVMLVGRSGVGKSAVIHEVIRRMETRRAEQNSGRKQVWLVSPQRLISGMSFVGQWENRVHAILKECRHKGHILFFDDLVGLFRAGISASSKVSAAQVLKPHIEKHDVRLLAEMTPEAFRILQELDRGFADLFHIIQLDEPAENENARILVHYQRELESRFKCRFMLDALPTAVEIMQRYQREIAMPGKVAGFLRQLAVKRRDQNVGRMDILKEFEARSGLRVTFLDESIRLERASILESLRRRIVGQNAAVEAMTDVVSVTKARLNDPECPPGSMLFLGPTGVGKTECAKALAEYLYGDASKLLRFDMNEFVDAYAVTRLVGTISEPEGLLTSAVRRQPFAVILLDEIEKAHPAAFDVLLQVLGEGRLTDALGRTADFTNCVIIMTSNLGVREAEGGVGLAGHDSRGDDAYVQAAQRFFRPEFFNRIDRVVPFTKLSREEIEHIAGLLLQDVFAREGLSRRRCVLQVDSLAMERVVDQGFHPTLGARAIKREIERRLTRPLSARLSQLNPEVPTIVNLMAREQDIAVGLNTLAPAKLPPNAAHRAPLDTDEIVGRIDVLLNRAEEVLTELQPEEGISQNAVTPELRRYFAIREQVEYLDNAVERFLDWQDRIANRRTAPEEESASKLSEDRPRRSQLGEYLHVDEGAWLELRSPNELAAFLTANADSPADEALPSRLRRLAASGALLNLMLTDDSGGDDRVLLMVRTVSGRQHSVPRNLMATFAALLLHRFELNVEDLKLDQSGATGAVVSGFLAGAITRALCGLHLYCWDAGLEPLQVLAEPIPADADPLEVANSIVERRRNWADAVARGEASADDDPAPLGDVLQVHFSGGETLDVRTAMVSRERPSLSLLWMWLLNSSPLPEADA